MMTPDNFADAVNKSMAEVRKSMQETAERLEAEFRRMASTAGMDDSASAERLRAGNAQFRELVESLRAEATRAAGQLSEGMNEMMAEFRRLLEATMPVWGDEGPAEPGSAQPPSAPTSDAAPAAPAPATAAETSAAKATKRRPAAKKKSTKKATKKRAAKKKAATKKKSTKKARDQEEVDEEGRDQEEVDEEGRDQEEGGGQDDQEGGQEEVDEEGRDQEGGEEVAVGPGVATLATGELEPPMASRRRLDAEMVRRQLVPSREAARREIIAGRVLVDGAFADKPARLVDGAQSVTLAGPPPRFVGRGGLKLDGALDAFAVDPTGLRCLDAGSSTGGFTDCLLQRGATSVVAVDVGTNQLHERLRSDPRVEVREQTDVRSLRPEQLDGPVDLVVGDLSFISLRLILPHLVPLVVDGGSLLLLVKPQFEAGRQEAARGRGVIADPAIWRRVLLDVAGWAEEAGAGLVGLIPSPITGTTGNVEFVVRLQRGRPTIPHRERIIDEAVATVDQAWSSGESA